MTLDTFPVGRALNDRYLIQRLQAQNCAYKIYIGRDQTTGDSVFVREYCPGGKDSLEQSRRFETDLSALKRLRHPSIERLFDYFQQNGRLYVVTEFVERMTLREILQSDASLTPELAFPVFKEVVEVLAHIHRNGVIHGNLNPDSIMLLASGSRLTQLVDFCCATMKAETLNPQRHHKWVSSAYFSPEHFNNELVDERSDIYSLGIVMYETLTGRLPFEGAPGEIERKHLTSLPPRFRAVTGGKSIPFEVEAIVLGCLSKRKEDRYQSASELLESIASSRAIVTGKTVEGASPVVAVTHLYSINQEGGAAARALLEKDVNSECEPPIEPAVKSPIEQPIKTSLHPATGPLPGGATIYGIKRPPALLASVAAATLILACSIPFILHQAGSLRKIEAKTAIASRPARSNVAPVDQGREGEAISPDIRHEKGNEQNAGFNKELPEGAARGDRIDKKRSQGAELKKRPRFSSSSTSGSEVETVRRRAYQTSYMVVQ